MPLKGLVYRLNFGNNYRIDNHFQASQYGYNLQGEAYKRACRYYDYTIDNIWLTTILHLANILIDATLLYGASERKYDYTKALGRDLHA